MEVWHNATTIEQDLGEDKMEQLLCSKGFSQFYDVLQEEAYGIEAVDIQMKKALPFVADEIHLGRMITELFAPSSVYDPKGKEISTEIFCLPDGYENTPQIESFQTAENGKVIITAYPRKGYVWNEAERKAIHFLAQNIYCVCGRARLMGLMRQATVTDSMTGVANTDGFMQFGGRLQAMGQLSQYEGLFINIKNFKYINQSVGARVGDKILFLYCQRISEFLSSDEILARLGGDNFVALIKKERQDEILSFLSDVQIEAELDSGDSQIFHLRAKIGIYLTGEEDTMGQVMNGVTVAYNMAKHSVNHDFVWFRPQMMEQTMHDKEISIIFPQAIENEEFIVYYQPKVTLSDNRLCGCEALVRWIREGKVVPPMEFIPVLEREGSVCDLDFYVFEHVCRDIRKWLDQNMEPVRVSVNFSKVHLHNQKLAEDILRILKRYDIDSTYIEIELTEMSGYEDFEALSEFVKCMKENGIHTSIDDFGTGYSSLNLLKDLNVDVIKLDRSFLNHIEQRNKPDEIVIKNIVHMINELNMEVIAEGVETSEQMEFLKDVNCHMAQGFLFDKPLPLDDYESRLTNDRVYEVQI